MSFINIMCQKNNLLCNMSNQMAEKCNYLIKKKTLLLHTSCNCRVDKGHRLLGPCLGISKGYDIAKEYQQITASSIWDSELFLGLTSDKPAGGLRDSSKHSSSKSSIQKAYFLVTNHIEKTQYYSRSPPRCHCHKRGNKKKKKHLLSQIRKQFAYPNKAFRLLIREKKKGLKSFYPNHLHRSIH